MLVQGLHPGGLVTNAQDGPVVGSCKDRGTRRQSGAGSHGVRVSSPSRGKTSRQQLRRPARGGARGERLPPRFESRSMKPRRRGWPHNAVNAPSATHLSLLHGSFCTTRISARFQETPTRPTLARTRCRRPPVAPGGRLLQAARSADSAQTPAERRPGAGVAARVTAAPCGACLAKRSRPDDGPAPSSRGSHRADNLHGSPAPRSHWSGTELPGRAEGRIRPVTTTRLDTPRPGTNPRGPLFPAGRLHAHRRPAVLLWRGGRGAGRCPRPSGRGTDSVPPAGCWGELGAPGPLVREGAAPRPRA